MVRLLFNIFSSEYYLNPYSTNDIDFWLWYTHLFKIDFCRQRISLWTSVVEATNVGILMAENNFIIMQKLENVQHKLFDFMMWSMWKKRNIKVLDNIFEFNQIVCERANNFLASYKNAQKVRTVASYRRTTRGSINGMD
jgi:hypothetical protein